MVTDSQCSYSCNTILVVANLLLSASLSKHPMDVYSYATEEHRDFKSLYKNVADCKSATTDGTWKHIKNKTHKFTNEEKKYLKENGWKIPE